VCVCVCVLVYICMHVGLYRYVSRGKQTLYIKSLLAEWAVQRVLQCVAVCCSVLQCVAVCSSKLQCVAVYCSALQCVAV